MEGCYTYMGSPVLKNSCEPIGLSCQGYTTNKFNVQSSKDITDKLVSNITKATSTIDDEGLYLRLVIPGTERESIKVKRIVTNLEISYHCGINDSDETFTFSLTNLYLPNFDFDNLMPLYENGILSIFIGYAEGSVEEYKVY